VESGVLSGDDFSPAAGAGAEENKRSECEEKAEHFLNDEFWMLDVGLWMLDFRLGEMRGADVECWIMNFGLENDWADVGRGSGS
jgi:hypothetical protein